MTDNELRAHDITLKLLDIQLEDMRLQKTDASFDYYNAYLGISKEILEKLNRDLPSNTEQ